MKGELIQVTFELFIFNKNWKEILNFTEKACFLQRYGYRNSKIILYVFYDGTIVGNESSCCEKREVYIWNGRKQVKSIYYNGIRGISMNS